MIERKIRAYDPWPGTYAIVRNDVGPERKLKIFSARITASQPNTKPGKIRLINDSVVVGTTDGALLLGEVQLEGKRRMTAAEFLRGHPAIVAFH